MPALVHAIACHVSGEIIYTRACLQITTEGDKNGGLWTTVTAAAAVFLV